MSKKVSFPDFYYRGEDLGAIYSILMTKFALWSPLTKSVELKLETKDGFKLFPMEKDVYNIYRVTVYGDFLNAAYCYVLHFEDKEEAVETLDPYAKGMVLNSKYNAVIDDELIRLRYNRRPKNEIKRPEDAIIYEVGVRDFTEDKHSNIQHKGTFEGFIEKKRKTKHGHKAGLDYLKELGITHVQLNPIMDFANVDDLKKDTYNWGYDVTSFFAIEGSYSTDPKTPMKRLLEFKKLVGKLHQNNIRVIMDVVYNHIFSYEQSCFEKIIPGYYFRKDKNGVVTNGSGCGNEFASEKPMVSKLIFDSIRYFVDVFDVDGFRFDLMGLLDTALLNGITSYVKSRKPDALVYGEGWNMGSILLEENRASADNYNLIPNVGLFNDQFRNTLNGNIFDPKAYGLIMGNPISINEFKATVLATRFNDPNISINYVECHDNATLFDRLAGMYPEDSTDDILRRIKLGNAMTLLFMGVPFIHMGQEIGQSKFGNDNSYNIKKVNNMSYALLDERYEMVHYFTDLVKLRKAGFGKGSSYQNAEFDIIKDDKGPHYIYHLHNETPIMGFKDCVVIINTAPVSFHYQFDDIYETLFVDSGLIGGSKHTYSSTLVPPISLMIFGKKVN